MRKEAALPTWFTRFQQSTSSVLIEKHVSITTAYPVISCLNASIDCTQRRFPFSIPFLLEGRRKRECNWLEGGGGLCEGDNVITFDTHLKLIDGALDLRWLRLWPLPKCAGTTKNTRHKRERERRRKKQASGGKWGVNGYDECGSNYMAAIWSTLEYSRTNLEGIAVLEQQERNRIGHWGVGGGLHKQLRLSMGCFAARHVAC